MSAKPLHIRVLHGIILINAFFVLMSGAIILISMWINAEKSANELSRALKEEIQVSVINQTNSYFHPAITFNKNLAFLLYHYFDNPIHKQTSREAMYGYFKEIMINHPQFKMVYYSDTHGALEMLNRMDDDTFSRRAVRNNGREITITWDHENTAWFSSYFNTTEPADTGYDPRRRGWYGLAQTTRGITWTPVYLFATDNLPGFTCVAPIFDPNGDLTGVSSIDIAVNELSRFLGTIQPTPGTKLFIVDHENNLIALQAKTEKDLEMLFVQSIDRNGREIFNISPVTSLPDKNNRFLLETLLDSGEESLIITCDEKKYMASAVPITVGNGLDLVLGIIIPEDDIVGNVRRNSRNVTIFSCFILLLAIVISGFFSKSIANPLHLLSIEMSKVKSFQLDSDVEIKTTLTEIIQIRDSFESMRSGLKNFKRYVPADLVAQLINENISADLGGENQELTVFFSDIAKFTTISEKKEPDAVVQDLCEYFEVVSKTILENSGTIDKYIGDAVMAFWGAPKKLENHAEKACFSAIKIRDNLHSLFRYWENKGKQPFNTRMGIHTGNVVVGNMGYKERLNYTVIGDTVNVSSRLEGINKTYGTEIIVSENTYEQCSDIFEFRLLDRVSLIGRYEGINIYELISLKDDINKNLKKVYEYYETGLSHYFHKNWEEAIKYFNGVLKYRPGDLPAKLMRERCMKYQIKPPPDGWNGVFAQTVK